MIYAYGESVRLNGRELSPNEYSIDHIAGVITLAPAIRGDVAFAFTVTRKKGRKTRSEAQWKREQRGCGR